MGFWTRVRLPSTPLMLSDDSDGIFFCTFSTLLVSTSLFNYNYHRLLIFVEKSIIVLD